MGTVVMSIDAELGWGHHDRRDPPKKRLDNARDGWIRLLELLERYDVPATWAIVGHLLLDECDGVHADYPAPPGWFEREHGEWRTRPDLRFGRDLVEAIRDAPVDHEIACHSFSHVEFDDVRTTRELARAEIETSIDVARSHGIEFESFVYPRNGIAHRDLLAEYGFTCFRGHSKERLSSVRPLRAFQKVARATVTAPPVVQPYRDEYGLVDVPSSMHLFGFENALRTAAESIWGDPIFEQVRRGIDRTADRDDGLFHVWFHPNDLIERQHVERVENILAYIARHRDESSLTVEPMGTVARRFLAEQDPPSV